MRDIADWESEGDTLSNLGLAFQDLGNYSMAMTYLEQSRQMFEKIGVQGKAAITCYDLGLLYKQQGDLARAVPLIQRWVDYLRQINHPAADSVASELSAIQAKLREQSSEDRI